MKISKKIIQQFIIFLVTGVAFFSLPFGAGISAVSSFEVKADALQDQLSQLKSQIQDIQSQKNQLQSQIDSNTYTIEGYSSQVTQLYGQAKILDDQIKEIKLQIQIYQTQIDQVQLDINQKQKDILNTESNVQTLEQLSESRIKDSYVNFRMYGEGDTSSTALNMKNINKFFKTSQYKEFIQSDSNKMLVKLGELKIQLADKQKQLNNSLLQLKKNKEEVDIKQTDLQQKKQDQDIKIAQYMVGLTNLQSLNNNSQVKILSISQEENVKRAEANKVEQQILNNFIPTNQGQYVVAGTIIGNKGCTGLCNGAHLHFMVYINGSMQNPCGYLPAGSVSGCGVGGSLLSTWPLKGDITLTSGFGHRCFQWGDHPYCDFHTGIDLVSEPWNAPVYSPVNGYIHKGVDPYGANYIIVCQSSNCNGIKLGFWHLSRY